MAVRNKKTLSIILIIVFLFFLLKIGAFNFIADWFNPSLRAATNGGVKTGSFLNNLEKNNLLSELDNLKNQNTELQKEVVSLRAELVQFDLLSRQVGFIDQQKYHYVLSNVIGQNTEVGINYYIVDRGRDDRIREGAAVIVNDGYLVGKIAKVDKNYAYFLPIYDNHFLTSVDFLTKDPKAGVISGLAKGKHGLNMQIDFVPLDKNINNGDYIITSGVEKDIPRGLIVGQVETVERKNESAFQNIITKPLVSLGDLRIVSIEVNDNL
ncbi:MAG: rod shape-determining protein MreC [Patescibacteria group bacterium]|nr:rod shape-determining protein MreC [Patescibacteria group bacterium]MDD5121617.1 rod shape-determining protein MreC [Patescibacteria group bacterium]MDD5222267.1 rod shape-determining protein MreC [Patescibacteria group bacterium]MDD5396219.1 rod shape-determining protein MreC [Patescibacteria group bacterium]